MEPEPIPDEELEKLTRDVAEALASAMRATDWEWRPLPFLPLTIGVNYCKGQRYRWWSWDVRFTWLREEK